MDRRAFLFGLSILSACGTRNASDADLDYATTISGPVDDLMISGVEVTLAPGIRIRPPDSGPGIAEFLGYAGLRSAAREESESFVDELDDILFQNLGDVYSPDGALLEVQITHMDIVVPTSIDDVAESVLVGTIRLTDKIGVQSGLLVTVTSVPSRTALVLGGMPGDSLARIAYDRLLNAFSGRVRQLLLGTENRIYPSE